MNDDGSPKVGPAPPPPPPPGQDRRPEGQGFRVGGRRALAEIAVALGALVGLVLLLYSFAGTLSAWLLPLVPKDVDRRLGELGALELEAAARPCEGAAEAYVRELGRRLAAAQGEESFTFVFRLVDDQGVNAFALPGGLVTVQRGLLEAAQSGEEVAAVLAHEIQHVVLRHGTRRMLRGLGGRVAIGLLFGGTELDGLAGVTGYLAALSYSRQDEAEADREGVDLLLRAGIDPSGLGTFFARLDQQGELRPPEILSTHPDPGDRGRVLVGVTGGLEPLPPLPEVHCSEP